MKLVELEIVVTGAAACVRLNAKARKEWDKLHAAHGGLVVQQRTQLGRYVAEFCSNEQHRANDQQFKKEGSFDDGTGEKAAVWTFKPWQWRLYGVIVTVAGKKCFVGTEVDPSKKTNKADQAALKRAALAMNEFEDYRAGKGSVEDGKAKRRGDHRKNVGKRDHRR